MIPILATKCSIARVMVLDTLGQDMAINLLGMAYSRPSGADFDPLALPSTLSVPCPKIKRKNFEFGHAYL